MNTKRGLKIVVAALALATGTPAAAQPVSWDVRELERVIDQCRVAAREVDISNFRRWVEATYPGIRDRIVATMICSAYTSGRVDGRSGR